MAVGGAVQPREIARCLAPELARAEGLVQGLWLTVRRGVAIFWVLTPPIDAAAQQGLYERTAIVYDEFPDAEFAVHILNPVWSAGGDARGALPADAEPVPLSPE